MLGSPSSSSSEEEEFSGATCDGIHQHTQKYNNSHWWWALAGSTQLGWGISSYLKGHSGDGRLMPFKAFAVASLFVGAAASASVSALQASGIHQVEDLMEVGSNLRAQLGIPPRTRDGKTDDL